jgi:hypothetical protein
MSQRAVLVSSDDWRDQAACIGQTWMAQRGNTKEAREVCMGCPSYKPCRDWVLSSPIGVTIPGVVAGLTPQQRGAVECSECDRPVPKGSSVLGMCPSCHKLTRRTA